MSPVVRWSPALLAAAALVASPGVAQKKKKGDDTPQLSVGRAPMTMPAEAEPAAPPPPPPTPPAPTTTIAQALPGLPEHVTLVRLVQSAQMEATLAGPGPFTVFAPSDDAFARLAPGTLDTLLKPENAATLTNILKYHVLASVVTMDQLKAQIAAGGGRAVLATLSGQLLTATLESGTVLLTDANGGKSYVSQPDLKESNGIVHVTNGVSVPKLG